MNTKERKIKLKLNEHKKQERRERAIGGEYACALNAIRLIISHNNNANDILPLFFFLEKDVLRFCHFQHSS